MTETTLVYDSGKAHASILGEIREIYRYRDFLKLLVSTMIKRRYKRSALGIVWTLLNPLIHMAVLTVVFSTLFHARIPHYPVYLLAGLTFWGFFSQSTQQAATQLVWGGSLIKRVHLPTTVFAVAAVANGLVNLVFASVPLVVIMLAVGHPLSTRLWFLPIGLLILAAFTLGVALFLSSIAVFFTDVVDMYQLLLQAWFYLTPIIYPRAIVGMQYEWFVKLNPMYYMIEMVREPVYDGCVPSWRAVLVALFLASSALLIGASFFTRKAHELAYRV